LHQNLPPMVRRVVGLGSKAQNLALPENYYLMPRHVSTMQAYSVNLFPGAQCEKFSPLDERDKFLSRKLLGRVLNITP
jgi:hypothetical protein